MTSAQLDQGNLPLKRDRQGVLTDAGVAGAPGTMKSIASIDGIYIFTMSTYPT